MEHIKKAHKDFVKELLYDRFDIEPEEAEDDSVIEDDFGLDSLDKVELIMRIEEQFDIVISDANIEDINTMADLYSHMDKALELKTK